MSSPLSATEYSTLVFDCDGVVLNSNQVKTRAFYRATLPCGRDYAEAMVDHHVANGGVSRYKKFAYFLEHIVPVKSLWDGPSLEELLENYAMKVHKGLLSCDLAPGLELFRNATPDARWLIVSGGDQAELRDVFAQRGIAKWFDGGIFGSPNTKDEILSCELASANIVRPALFLGDSKYDYEAAMVAGLEFLFVSMWTEVADWETWVAENGIYHTSDLHALIE